MKIHEVASSAIELQHTQTKEWREPAISYKSTFILPNNRFKIKTLGNESNHFVQNRLLSHLGWTPKWTINQQSWPIGSYLYVYVRIAMHFNS